MLQVAGMLILNAHNVSDTSGEGFAVRLFRKGNQRGFVRALSDQPSFFASGFAKVQRPQDMLSALNDRADWTPFTQLSIHACCCRLRRS
jgi:DNA excision repair protein ERCC-4